MINDYLNNLTSSLYGRIEATAMGETIKMTLHTSTQYPCSVQAAQRLGELEAENSRLKRLLAELLIKNQELRENFRIAAKFHPDVLSLVAMAES